MARKEVLNDNKRVAVILLSSRQEKDLVVDCLNSLSKTDYPKDLLDVVLVDNFSEDDTVEVVRRDFPSVHIIQNKNNMGFAAGNNVGIFYSLKHGAEYVMILNNDTLVHPLWLHELLLVFEIDASIGCATSKIYLYNHPKLINTDGNIIQFLGFSYCGNYKKEDNENDTEPREVTYPSGAAMLLKKTVIEKLGGFEEKLFIYHDDVEFGWRMLLAGYKTYIAPRSKIWHKYAFAKPSNSKWYLLERNRFIILFENYKIGTLLLLAPACIIMECGIYWYALTQRWILAKIRADLYFCNPKNILDIIKERKKKKRLRTVSDREIVRRFVGVVDFQDVRHPLLQYVGNPFFHLYWLIVRRFIWW